MITKEVLARLRVDHGSSTLLVWLLDAIDEMKVKLDFATKTCRALQKDDEDTREDVEDLRAENIALKAKVEELYDRSERSGTERDYLMLMLGCLPSEGIEAGDAAVRKLNAKIKGKAVGCRSCSRVPRYGCQECKLKRPRTKVKP